MRAKNPELTADEVREWLDYNPVTGVFRWKTARGRNCSCIGKVAGYWQRGRLRIKVKDRLIEASRLAWLYVHGDWPTVDIDHIDRDSTNNRIDNLREATRQQNCCNSGVRVTNKSGFKGVSFDKQSKSWAAKISVCGTRYKFNGFASPRQAYGAYRIAAAALHGCFSGVS